jgi:hypothetical protein
MIPTALLIVICIIAVSVLIIVIGTFLSNIDNAIDNAITRISNKKPPLSEREISVSIV